MITLRRVRSDDARRNWRSIFNEAERGGFIGIGRYQDEPTVAVVPVEWLRKILAERGETLNVTSGT